MTQRTAACANLLAQLSEYFDDEASEAICRAVEKHMAECPDCTAMVNTLRKTIDLYHAHVSEPGLPADVRIRLFERLDLQDLAGSQSTTE
jgi:anti-sigma factor RsiW